MIEFNIVIVGDKKPCIEVINAVNRISKEIHYNNNINKKSQIKQAFETKKNKRDNKEN